MDIFNNIISWVGDKLNYVLSLICVVLPDSPFKLLDKSPIGEYIGYINYFVPLDFMLDSISAWLAAIVIYYGVQIIMRWAKAIK